ncbi:MAG: DegT/DnrJ/EryC1/StrS family aminotransferase [Planctomycetaceae bacterium]|jgi:perosamine synthetase|nr:DegT/DnrJ/EryC1/StrS family aminotransferase [Planctomycetaceae bacterium]
MYQYPVYRPSLDGNEKKYVNECIDSTWISSRGKFVTEFEKQFSQAIGVEHSIAVTNGTTAIHLAMLALGISHNDEVIVPTLTYIASVNPIRYVGAIPVFADSLVETWQLDPTDIAKKISPRTKAIIVVHLYGQPCEMNEICVLAKQHGLFVIEDCAEAFGSLYHGQSVGNFGDIATFSFFGNKTITCGEGGMVSTNDETLYDRCQHFKGQGLAQYREYWHDVVGYNFRMTNIAAAIGLAQLEQANVFIEKKRCIARWYIEGLQGLPIEYQHEQSHSKHSYWMFSILAEDRVVRDQLREYLKNNGIETRPLFFPVHTMPMYADKFQKHPVAENLSWCGINLPSYPALEQSDVILICQTIRNFFQ